MANKILQIWFALCRSIEWILIEKHRQKTCCVSGFEWSQFASTGSWVMWWGGWTTTSDLYRFQSLQLSFSSISTADCCPVLFVMEWRSLRCDSSNEIGRGEKRQHFRIVSIVGSENLHSFKLFVSSSLFKTSLLLCERVVFVNLIKSARENLCKVRRVFVSYFWAANVHRKTKYISDFSFLRCYREVFPSLRVISLSLELKWESSHDGNISKSDNDDDEKFLIYESECESSSAAVNIFILCAAFDFVRRAS